jgi:hypothetical protein
MKRSFFYPKGQGQQVIWLSNFRGKIAGHAAALGLSPEQVAGVVADCIWLIYVLQSWLPAVRAWAQGCTAAVDDAENGTRAGAQVLPTFTAPGIPYDGGVIARSTL